jgi:cyclopropane-fatty-acyl-phospholipid synthase
MNPPTTPNPTRTMSYTEQTVTPPRARARTKTRAPGVSKLSRLRRRLSQATVPPFEVELQDGTIERLVGGSYTGDDTDEPRFRLRMRNSKGLRALQELDELTLGIAFLDGDYDIEGDFLSCLELRAIFTDRHPVKSIMRFVIPIIKGQRKSDMAWVPHHYDFGNEFYFAFLDKRFQMYSQALYTAENESLEQAVTNKLQYIVDSCRLTEGSHVLDVGAGWGALEKFTGPKGINTTMLTISHEQFKFLSEWCGTHGMPARLDVVRESIFAYEPPTQYDAIVLLGVMEHLPDYKKLFAQFRRLVKPGGRVYMDFCSNRTKFSVSSFTYNYVFPGNHTPVYMPGLLEGGNASGFEPVAIHNDRHSYYLTLATWARRLEAARETLVPKFGERVFRLFQLYLWGCAQQLGNNGQLESYRVVFQRSHGRPSSEIGCYRPI